MTATITPQRPATRTGRDGFGRLLHADWTKFRTVRGWMIAMVIAALVTLGIGLWAGNGGQNGCGQQITPGARPAAWSSVTPMCRWGRAANR
jgi:hypothetical protein